MADLTINLDSIALDGNLIVPAGAKAMVVFAHGSGSSRHSPRNRFVAEHLHEAGLATLLFDLLTADEEIQERQTRHLRFDIPLLADRLTEVVDWARRRDATASMPIGLFGASTGAAAALVTASARPDDIAAVVSRGGRPDLAGDALPLVRAPVELIVGERDGDVLALNREAAARLTAPVAIDVVPGATHLFEEPGALEQVADLARQWFARHLGNRE